MHSQKNILYYSLLVWILLAANTILLKVAYLHNRGIYLCLFITVPLLLVAVYLSRQGKNKVLKIVPLDKPQKHQPMNNTIVRPLRKKEVYNRRSRQWKY